MRWRPLGLVWLARITAAGAVDDPPLRAPEAAGVAMASLDDARAVLPRLRPLDPREAEDLDR